MGSRYAALVVICCWMGTTAGSAAGQLPTYPAAKAGDAGYIAEDPAHAALVGKPGPSLSLRLIDGGSIDVAKTYGRTPVYLKLWATYCIPCRAQMPGFEAMYETYSDRMQIIAIDAGVGDDPAKVREFVTKAKMRMPVAIDDGSLGAWLDMEATPFHLVIGRDGKIAYAGHQDGARLDAAIQRVLSAKGAAETRIPTSAVNPVEPLKPGDLVPVIDLRDADNMPFHFPGDATGRPRAVVFTAVWCETYLKDTEPDTVEACKRVREQADHLSQSGAAEWVGIVAHLWTTSKSLASYQARVKPRVPMALDDAGLAFRLFGIRRLPVVALIGADGRLVRVVGPDDRDLTAAVERLTANRHVDPDY